MADSEEFSADDLEKLVGDILKKKNEGPHKGATEEGAGEPPGQVGNSPVPDIGTQGKPGEPPGLSPDALAALDNWLKRAPLPNPTPDTPNQPKEESLEELLRKITPLEQPSGPAPQPDAGQPIEQAAKEVPGEISQPPASPESQSQSVPPSTSAPSSDIAGIQGNLPSNQPPASEPEKQMVTLPADELMGLVQKLSRLEGVLDDLMKIVETMRSEAKPPTPPATPPGLAEIEQMLKATLPMTPVAETPPPPVFASPVETLGAPVQQAPEVPPAPAATTPAEPPATPSPLSQVKDLAEAAVQPTLDPVRPEVQTPTKAESNSETVTEPFQLRPGPEVLAGHAAEVLPKAEDKKPKGSSAFGGLRRLLNTPIGPRKVGQGQKSAKMPKAKAKAEEPVKATPKKPKTKAPEQSIADDNADYRGRVELEIKGEFEWSQLMDLQRELSKVAGIKYKGVWGSDAKTATLVLELGRSMPLIQSLRNLPSVRSVTAGRQPKGDQVLVVTLGSATQPVK